MGGRFDAIAQPGEERGVGFVQMDKAKAGLGFFERYLSLWVALCIVVGIGLGAVLPGPFRLLGEANIAKVNLPVALLVWLMIIPMLLRVDFGALGAVGLVLLLLQTLLFLAVGGGLGLAAGAAVLVASQRRRPAAA